MKKDFSDQADRAFRVHLLRLEEALFALKAKKFDVFFRKQKLIRASWANFLSIIYHLDSTQLSLIFDENLFSFLLSNLISEVRLNEDEILKSLSRIKKEKKYLMQIKLQTNLNENQFELSI